jgi:hypothetical protein
MTKATTNILSIFDTEAASETGAWLHLSVPGSDGELAYADADKKNPLRIKLKGPESDTWVAFFRKAAQQDNKKDKRTAQEVRLDDSKLMARMTLEVENIPGADATDRESLIRMYMDYRDIRLQALSFVMNRENFIGMPAND